MKVCELKRTLQMLGDYKVSELIDFYNRPYKCPKCNGEGFEQVTYNAYPTGLPDSGWVSDMKTKRVECEVCDGHGYTKKEMKAVTKIEVIGYE